MCLFFCTRLKFGKHDVKKEGKCFHLPNSLIKAIACLVVFYTPVNSKHRFVRLSFAGSYCTSDKHAD